MIDGNAYYYVGYSEPVTGVAILDVAFQMHGWLVVDEDGNYTISEEYVELDEPDSSGGESAEGESAEGESAEEESAEGESPEGESPEGEPAEGESPEGESEEGTPAGDDKAPAADDKAADDKAAASDDDMLEAYKQYMTEWINAENEINDAMTDEQLPEFIACIEANDYSQFPGDMFFNGMLESGSAMTYEEFVAAAGK